MHFIVTAGPTREYLDPVRFLSNPSTGKMGFAVAAEAARRGHDVTLIAGPVALKTPKGVRRVDVVSAREMLERSLEGLGGLGCLESLGGLEGLGGSERVAFVSTAAVADWRPARCVAQKLKKRQMSGVLRLVRNPDILKTISKLSKPSEPPKPPRLSLVGFAAETNDVLAEAARKCREKGLAFIVANDVTEKGSGFGTETDRVTFVFPDGTQKKFPLMTKRRVAAALVRELEADGLSSTDRDRASDETISAPLAVGRTIWYTTHHRDIKRRCATRRVAPTEPEQTRATVERKDSGCASRVWGKH